MSDQQSAEGLRSAEKSGQCARLFGGGGFQGTPGNCRPEQVEKMPHALGIGGLLDGPGPDQAFHQRKFNRQLLDCACPSVVLSGTVSSTTRAWVVRCCGGLNVVKSPRQKPRPYNRCESTINGIVKMLRNTSFFAASTATFASTIKP